MNENIINKKSILLCISGLLFLASIILNVFFLLSDYNIKYKNDENILFFGDSLVEKYEVKSFFKKNNVVNKGISGNKTVDLIDRIEKDVYDYNPSKIFILIGINDMAVGIDDDDILLNIATIISDIKMNRPYSDIYVESLYPVNNDVIKDMKYDYASSLDNKRIKEFNIKLESLCDLNEVTFINVHDKLLENSGQLKKMYTRDGLHLNKLGYLKVTSVLKEYLSD